MMSAESAAGPQRVSLYNRVLLGIVIFLVFVAGVQLVVLAGHTDRYFAWTIALPLSAALIGAGYWSALVPAVFAWPQSFWHDFRSSLPAAFSATTLALVATLLHLDRFHLNSPEFIPRLAAWVWLLVYGVVPPALVVGWLLQRRMPGQEPPSRGDLPAWLRWLLHFQVALTLAAGAALFLLPQTLTPVWAWALTPLTARMTGAWLCAYGVASGVMLMENDLARLRGGMAGLLTFGLLQLLALLRYPGSVDWRKPSAWLYVMFLLTVILMNGAGLTAYFRRSRLRHG
jgi:hypothetical protein